MLLSFQASALKQPQLLKTSEKLYESVYTLLNEIENSNRDPRANWDYYLHGDIR